MPTETPYGYITPSVAITTVAAPTAPNSTAAFVLQGLAAILAPATPSGNVLCIISGTLTSTTTTVGDGVILQLYYGPIISGTAPPTVNTAPPASGVAFGATLEWATGVTLTTAASSFIPFTIHGIAKALVPAQQYWFDVAAKEVGTASHVALTNVTISLAEIG